MRILSINRCCIRRKLPPGRKSVIEEVLEKAVRGRGHLSFSVSQKTYDQGECIFKVEMPQGEQAGKRRLPVQICLF